MDKKQVIADIKRLLGKGTECLYQHENGKTYAIFRLFDGRYRITDQLDIWQSYTISRTTSTIDRLADIIIAL